ncbi:lipase member I-like [Adelges cooleyi]|uniref:lipase member I-like n=1 Tax=Adelges cooleyi TaxID=133065 RepID=UPI002180398B|nr:lipase member I-like [Adelges cooleyi]
MHLLCYYVSISVAALSVLKLSTATEECSEPPVIAEKEVDFFLYTKQTALFPIDTNDEQTILNAPLAEGSDKIVFIVHGYSEHHDNKTMDAIRLAYKNKEDDSNVIMVDYFKIANTAKGYVKSVCAVSAISKIIAECIALLKKLRAEITNYHVIGFSMGAHVACKVGTILADQDIMLDRVTALDPAKPLFSGPKNEVNRSCAKFVDVIHTNINIIGMGEPSGTADIYINDGQNQPDCYKKTGLVDMCNHITAPFFYAATITDGDKYKATHCFDYKEEGSVNGECAQLYDDYRREDFKAIVVICSANVDSTKTVVVGEYMPSDSKGVYQLQFKESLTGIPDPIQSSPSL